MTSIDAKELSKFNKTPEEWWDTNGEFKLLHEINPLRLEYISEKIEKHFSLKSSMSDRDFSNLKILDVGCGGGLISVPLAKLKANILGIDANISNINTCEQIIAKESNIKAIFKNTTVEDLVFKRGFKKVFDVILALEVIEHVQNPKDFVLNLSKLLKPGGMIILSTINRTAKSYLLAIVMAEYILGFVPKNTHNHSKFVKPSELYNYLQKTNLSLKNLKGMELDLATRKWLLSDNIDVNYFACIA